MKSIKYSELNRAQLMIESLLSDIEKEKRKLSKLLYAKQRWDKAFAKIVKSKVNPLREELNDYYTQTGLEEEVGKVKVLITDKDGFPRTDKAGEALRKEKRIEIQKKIDDLDIEFKTIDEDPENGFYIFKEVDRTKVEVFLQEELNGIFFPEISQEEILALMEEEEPKEEKK